MWGEQEDAMKKLLITALAATALAATSVPASAQFFAGADSRGVGVQVGPLGVGVGPRFGWHDPYWRDHYAYAGRDCRIVRERRVSPSGRVIISRNRVCY
jgi:hypothetical protein